ncbi:MAG: hypothetical protein NZ570_06890 [Candidatus Caldarchaeum sp.]|nr:hypothetical protein [Candidatus Caldarchaeum sp.]MCS7136807.1 hypothetical protein [Candidatus Caldarchaeum sp.]MDW7977749.1 hypothetical protein [Candidatus Caldarchaeum sp.]MDW8359079.1 hypothetical protein [Candidatus Caldarchaeum sp.]
MAKIVCGLAMTHNPRIFYTTTPPPEAEKQRILKVFAKLKEVREETRAETLLIIGNHHLTTFLETIPSFAIGVSETAHGPTSFEVEAGIPAYRCRVQYDAAEHLLEKCVANDFDVARASEYVLDHAFTIPLWFISPEMQTPIIPVFTNVHVPPIPRPMRFYKLGKALAEGVESCKHVERVGVVASFNLSLNVGNSRMGRYDEKFDRLFIEGMSEGRLGSLVDEVGLDRMMSAGNSTVEVLNLYTLFGVLGDRKPVVCFNEVVKGWGTVSAAVWKLV